jgi:hypothetical protein
MIKTLTQSEFARRHGVTRKTVNEWRWRGYVVLGANGGRVGMAVHPNTRRSLEGFCVMPVLAV